MNTTPTISYELAQARITDLHHQARRPSQARAAHAEPQSRQAARSRPDPLPGRRDRVAAQS